ncbi:unnamed protein product [Tilletia controversa]|nr:unnamed protein product [Tilletia controversa]
MFGGRVRARPAAVMKHNFDYFDIPDDPDEVDRAGRQIDTFLRAEQTRIAAQHDSDPLGVGPGHDMGDDFSAGPPHDHAEQTRGSDWESDDSDWESDASVVRGPLRLGPSSINVNLLPKHSYARENPALHRFLAWHAAVPAILRQIYDNSPSIPPSKYPTLCCPCTPNSCLRRPILIHVYDIGQPFPVAGQSCSSRLVEALIKSGLFPASPSNPRVAFTIKLLRLYQILIDQIGMPANNMAATVKCLMRVDGTFRRTSLHIDIGDTLRKQLKSAATWMTAVECYQQRMAILGHPTWTRYIPSLADDDLILTLGDLIDSCPACFQAFVPERNIDSTFIGPLPAPRVVIGSHADAPQVIIALDGNFTQKRRKRKDPVSMQPFPPRRFLSAKQVSEAERALRAAKGTNPDKDNCIAQIRAVNSGTATSASSPFEVTGIMGACCRHDVPLVLCDITTPGERHYYATALIQAIVRAIPHMTHLGIAYDIGCRFDPSTRVKDLLGEQVQISWAVPIFHVYGHTYTCQMRYNPRNIEGFGLTDGEGMERVWSGLSNLIPTTRSMSRGERRFNLEQRCDHLAVERRINMFKSLKARRKRMEQVITKAQNILGPNFDLTCVPAQFQADLTSAAGRSDAGSTADSLLADTDIEWTPPRVFEGIAPDVVTVVRKMVLARRSVVRDTSDTAENAAATGVADDAVPAENDPVTMDREESTDEDDPADTVIVTRIGVLAMKLLRTLAEVQLLSTLIQDRPANVRRGTAATGRLSLSLKNQRTSAKASMSKLNEALRNAPVEHLRSRSSSHVRSESVVLPLLDASSLFSPDTFVRIEQWATASGSPLASLPWWAKSSTASAMNAFEELGRASKEDHRLNHERSSALAWISERIRYLSLRRDAHPIYQDALRQAQALNAHWLGLADYSGSLWPAGVELDVAVPPDNDIDAGHEAELQAQLAQLAVGE